MSLAILMAKSRDVLILFTETGWGKLIGRMFAAADSDVVRLLREASLILHATIEKTAAYAAIV
jgi:hypothetical protein